MVGYEEGRELKNITRRLLSDTVQDSLPQFGLVPTYQNASVRPSLHSNELRMLFSAQGRMAYAVAPWHALHYYAVFHMSACAKASQKNAV